MIYAREKYDRGIFTIRFYGEPLKKRGVSIYDLGLSLVAIQRIVNKAHLALEGELIKGAFPDRAQREHLALQLGERRRQSDAFALIPILTDSSTRDYLIKVADYVVSGLIGYATGKVMDRIRGEKDDDKRIYIGAIYAEMVNIGSRVNASGGLEAISLGAPALEKETIATFDADAKHYLGTLRKEVVLGRYQEITGRVYKLYPASKIVAIKRGKRTVSIFLGDKNFDRVRYSQVTNPLVCFKGRPRYQLGVVTRIFSEFEADGIEILKGEDL